jgi:DHA2 family multidrug resistance protein-like MFS transporter
VPEQARDGLGGSLAVAAHLPADAGRALVHAAGRSYVSAMDSGVLVGAGVALVGALVALVWMPAKEHAAQAVPAPAVVGDEAVPVGAGC